MIDQNELNVWLDSTCNKILKKIQAEVIRVGAIIPYIAEDGAYKEDMCETNISYWTNGFWSGMLWQLYHSFGDENFKKTACTNEAALDTALQNFEGLHHDVGFMWLQTAVANYKLTGNPDSRKRALHAATILAGRYNPAGKFIRAWNLDKIGWMIIDCMMNVPLLTWASKETGDPRFAFIANEHVKTTQRVLVRADGSCHHIAVMNPHTGEVIEFPEGQGYCSGSSWTRGQAWALYGFALAYKNMGDIGYLETAKAVAHYFMANVEQTGFVSLVDFRQPLSPTRYDTTASACAASGLLEIADHVPENEKALYRNCAIKILQALDRQYCDWNTTSDGILQYGTVAYHREDGNHVPIIYGDYFFIEAVLRLHNKHFDLWG